MLPITQMTLTNHNRPKKKLLGVKGIVIHYTASVNKGADADNVRNYFNTTTRGASSQYIVDDHQIVQCMPDDEVAWHVGAKTYTEIGMKMTKGTMAPDDKPFYGPNYFTIGIEMCVNSDGDWEKTCKNTAELVVYLLKKYNLTVNDVYRHHDITGKVCPAMMTTPALWNEMVRYFNKEGFSTAHLKYTPWTQFKETLTAMMNPAPVKPPTPPVPPKPITKTGVVTATKLNVRTKGHKTAGISKAKPFLLKGEKVTILKEQNGWYMIGTDMWVSAEFVKVEGK